MPENAALNVYSAAGSHANVKIKCNESTTHNSKFWLKVGTFSNTHTKRYCRLKRVSFSICVFFNLLIPFLFTVVGSFINNALR